MHIVIIIITISYV